MVLLPGTLLFIVVCYRQCLPRAQFQLIFTHVTPSLNVTLPLTLLPVCYLYQQLVVTQSFLVISVGGELFAASNLLADGRACCAPASLPPSLVPSSMPPPTPNAITRANPHSSITPILNNATLQYPTRPYSNTQCSNTPALIDSLTRKSHTPMLKYPNTRIHSNHILKYSNTALPCPNIPNTPHPTRGRAAISFPGV